MICLLLDFDGVLHPDAVFLDNDTPVLRAHGAMFMWAGILSNALRPYDAAKAQIVLSTSWASALSFERARDALPSELAERVVDATWQKKGYYKESGISPKQFAEMTRYAQIKQYLDRKNIIDWLAIDNDDRGWAAEHRHRLVKTDDMTGLSVPAVQQELETKLALYAKRSAA